SYEKFISAYDAICDRVGLEWYRVESDVGMMGGSGAHEYMAPCPAGENDVVLAPGYAANIEVASADPQSVAPIDIDDDLHTPVATTLKAGSDAPAVQAGNLHNAYPVVPPAPRLHLVF